MTRPATPPSTPDQLERVVATLAERLERRFFGKYRAWVVDNEDPARLGRLRLRVPSVLGPDTVTGWASPCAPYGGSAGHGLLFVPERDAGVWAEFEEGDLEFPIWVGTFWTRPSGSSQLPLTRDADGVEAGEPQAVPTCKTLTTFKKHTLQFEDADDAEGVLLREGVHGHRVTLNGDGVTVVDADGDTVVLGHKSIRLTDADGNEVLLGEKAIRLTDVTGNAVELTKTALTITAKAPLTIDASGQPVKIIATSIALEKG
jgi:hypothetical protein